ncbi:MAG: SCP2 sterol-binding domain-containing protein [Actinomycetota bacterium]|nr:SCP2 sterol-binding domain-containing protein [Actinomycetota bacterium]
MPESYPFLSDEWMVEARKIREEFRGRVPAAGEQAVRMNQVITEVPFGGGTLEAHLDTSSGEMELDTGHLEDAEVTITLDYETAKAVFVDPQSAIQHFMAGKIKVQGDMTKLLGMVQAPPDPVTAEVQQRIAGITQ